MKRTMSGIVPPTNPSAAPVKVENIVCAVPVAVARRLNLRICLPPPISSRFAESASNSSISLSIEKVLLIIEEPLEKIRWKAFANALSRVASSFSGTLSSRNKSSFVGSLFS